VEATVAALVDRVTRRLRAGHRVCRTVVLRLRFADFSRATRSQTLVQTTAETRLVLETARDLLEAAWPTIEQRGLTLVGISVTNLVRDDAVQLALSFDPRYEDLDAALDVVRDRFGSTAVTRAVLLGRSPGVVMPVLPD
jgi:DNA polymerase-4